jgi:hypothetical protein
MAVHLLQTTSHHRPDFDVARVSPEQAPTADSRRAGTADGGHFALTEKRLEPLVTRRDALFVELNRSHKMSLPDGGGKRSR